MTDQILINTGPSPRGWHRLDSVLRCPQFFAFRYLIGLESNLSPGRLRGSILHAGLAHHYARIKLRGEGLDPDQYFLPEEAMVLVADKLAAVGELPLCQEIFRDYVQHWGEEDLTVLAVEQLVSGKVGDHQYTARWDLVIRDTAGRVWIFDHKSAFRVDARTKAAYTMSGQFLAMAYLGPQIFGSAFGGVRINLLSTQSPRHFTRISPEPAPGMLARFPTTVAYAENHIAALAASGWDPSSYPRASSDQLCVSKYGLCDFYDRCQWS